MTKESQKPALKCKTETIVRVDSDELENFIQTVYGVSYDIVGNQEWGNDSQHTCTIQEKKTLDAHDLKKLNGFKEGKSISYCLLIILQDLVNQGLLQPAQYLISVCW